VHVSRRRSFIAPVIGLVISAVTLGACGGSVAPTPSQLGGELILATTTSTQDSGLLDVLVPMFEEQTGTEAKIIAVGTGAALEMAGKGDADAVLVHSPSSEKPYVERGDLVNGQLVMHNDFVIVGPASDPAGVATAADLDAAMAAIAKSGIFISRGDNSGTNTKELALWKRAGLDPATVARREESGQGMGATLQIASEKAGYTLTDRATFLAQSANLDLEILREGDPILLNIYHVYEVNADKHSKVNRAQAAAFVAFMVAPETQKAIGEFGVAEFGQPLFFPDAGKDESTLGQ
jgi:tungstate transport system substrate-binding protein